ncbi:MAG: Stk1 family PASTA domain-containing Ser/Thr kinase [Oscillospiraceae bacterium]|nr:Stk1 family PASTA domain-containing Ser/Thr kinase [Oscillospiraceae bacterium]
MDKDKYIGRLLDGRYEILEVIGTGGMAVVYKARCHRLNRLVAIKILKDDYLQDEEFRQRFHDEGQAVAMLSHPNIVSVYDVSSSSEADFIVMELIDGITLKQYMEKKGVLNWKETLHFAMQIAKALEHAHGRGIVHRDIKPHNVMVLKNGSVKVADFGIARVMSKSNTLTKEALGSVHYISPEQAKGGRVDNRSDIYSLGIVMYEMIAGRVPYDGESPVSVAIQHINGGAAKPSVFNPNIPTGLEQIILKSMALAPAERYATATAMLYEMDEFRKDPMVVFPEKPQVDDATRVLPADLPEETPQPPKTIAERTAAGKTGTPKPRQSQKPKPREDEEGRNRIATIAIASCVVVAIVAIIIFFVLLGQGELFGKPPMVTVPDLIGEDFNTLRDYEGIIVERQDSKNSDEFEKGQIMDQYPLPGKDVVSGTKVFVIVSLGAEAPEKTMEELVTVKADEAERFLLGLDMKLNIIKYEENHPTIPEGSVTRTQPAKGEVLTEGQTVRIWVSKGPEVIMAEVPNVVGKSVEDAIDILKANGFENVRQNPVDSDKPKNQVVGQSQERYIKIDVTTLIILDVSTGVSQLPTQPSEPEDPEDPDNTPTTTQPPEDDPEPTPGDVQVQLEYVFLVPSRTESYVLSIKAGEEWYIENMTIQPGATTVPVSLTGSGTVVYELYIDGELYTTETVEFDPDE